MTRQNAIWNCKNPFQGKEPRVLCVCSAGLLRSPTLAWVLGNNGCNTRACGIHDYALIEMDEVLVKWADLIIFVEESLRQQCKLDLTGKNVEVLSIPDKFEFKHPTLVKIIKEQLKEKELM